MRINIELESLDDLINLIGLFRTIQKEQVTSKQTESTPLKQTEQTTPKIEKGESKKNSKDYDQFPHSKERSDFINSKIEVLGIYRAAENSLNERGVFRISDLMKLSVLDLRRTERVGNLTRMIIQNKLKKYGCYLKGEHDSK